MAVITIKKEISEAGFINGSLSRYFTQTAGLSSWTHWYHKPYANDWKDARQKAQDRLNRSIEE